MLLSPWRLFPLIWQQWEIVRVFLHLLITILVRFISWNHFCDCLYQKYFSAGLTIHPNLTLSHSERLSRRGRLPLSVKPENVVSGKATHCPRYVLHATTTDSAGEYQSFWFRGDPNWTNSSCFLEQLLPAGMPPMSTPPPTSRPYRGGNSTTINSRPQMYQQPPSLEGPVITVFIGNISERAPEAMIKKILATCGTVINWKRVSTFGFCEYE